MTYALLPGTYYHLTGDSLFWNVRLWRGLYKFVSLLADTEGMAVAQLFVSARDHPALPSCGYNRVTVYRAPRTCLVRSSIVSNRAALNQQENARLARPSTDSRYAWILDNPPVGDPALVNLAACFVTDVQPQGQPQAGKLRCRGCNRPCHANRLPHHRCFRVNT